eukprot:4946516-Prymnesium_polylepis.1
MAFGARSSTLLACVALASCATNVRQFTRLRPNCSAVGFGCRTKYCDTSKKADVCSLCICRNCHDCLTQLSLIHI